MIYRARWREIQVVVKKFKIENGDVSLRDFLSECHAMEAVRHPNIVMFLGVIFVLLRQSQQTRIIRLSSSIVREALFGLICKINKIKFPGRKEEGLLSK